LDSPYTLREPAIVKRAMQERERLQGQLVPIASPAE